MKAISSPLSQWPSKIVARSKKSSQQPSPNNKNVVIFPSKAVPIENALQLFSPRLAIVDEHLTQHLPRQWLTSLKIEKQIILQGMYSVIEAPRQSDLMIELIKKLKPQVVVVTGIAHFEAVTTSAFEHLLNITGKIGSCLFLDISDHFELSSIPVSNGVLKYLSGTPLPPPMQQLYVA